MIEYTQHEIGKIMPVMDKQQYVDLEQDIIHNGIIHPIVIYEGKILDGWHRYNICTTNNLPFTTSSYEGDCPISYVASSNKRKHYTASQLAAIATDVKPLLEEEAKKRMSLGGQRKGMGKVPIASNRTTRDIVSEMFGVNTKYIDTASQIKKESPELFKELKAGVKNIADIKRQKKIDKRLDTIKALKIQTALENKTINDKFDVIVIDPPWNYAERGGSSGESYTPENRGQVPYNTMTLEAIADIQLPIKSNAVVFLWTTTAFLHDAFHILDKWGCQYKATIVWDKEIMGLGRNIRLQCEYCLLATKGNPIIQGSSTRDIIREKRREHSRKPEAFYTLVETITIGSRLDYFARENRKGWSVFGAETNKFAKN
jgi:N6-adenosine-specific RNA methylase IME4